jgi:alpha-1,6-mannosyltransferase
MRICDVTQFYSPFGGGVKRYLTEKRRYVERYTRDEHILIIPGAANSHVQEGRLHTYTVKSPLVSPTTLYRALLNQDAIRQLLRLTRPDVIESGDPYQVAWTVLREAEKLNIPTVGFYHSHFADSYLRVVGKFCGPWVRDAVLARSRDYVVKLYNKFNYTLVAAEKLRNVLGGWGVANVRPVKLGVDTTAFQPGPEDPSIRRRLKIPESAFLLLFVGRLAAEKNIATLLDAFERLRRSGSADYRLLCVGQGPWRDQLLDTREATGGAVSWIPHISHSAELARLYRSCDLAVHPSLNETFGLVPLEAQGCGLPVCGIRGSCLDSNIMAGLELWADENSGRSLAAAIERMQTADRRKLGQIAAEKVRAHYSWKTVLDDLWGHYEELVHGSEYATARLQQAKHESDRAGSARRFRAAETAHARYFDGQGTALGMEENEV